MKKKTKKIQKPIHDDCMSMENFDAIMSGMIYVEKLVVDYLTIISKMDGKIVDEDIDRIKSAFNPKVD
jgi:hypothetical protein